MNKVLLGLLLGAHLGAIDGATAWLQLWSARKSRESSWARPSKD